MKLIKLLTLILTTSAYTQDVSYINAFSELEQMLETKEYNFKDAVFITENAYHQDTLDQELYNWQIGGLVFLAESWLKTNKLDNYNHKDSIDFGKNAAIFKILTDTTYYKEGVPMGVGFKYDFNDFFGEDDWNKQFVTKLLRTESGNCHSMPYLYKILADEIETKASLALAPNHIYIKCRSKDPQISFYNTELTSKCFPIDAWLMASSGITTETIISGIWMEALNDEQSIALCLVDLGQGYMHKDQNYHKEFVIQCCDLALKHYPHCANALLLKGEVLRLKYIQDNNQETYSQMNEVYTNLFELGYREVPKGTYLQWLEELAKNQDKYDNKNLKP